MRQKVQAQQKWRGVIFAQKDSGLLPGEYCRRKGLCKTSFYIWRKRLGMAKDSAGPERLAQGSFIRLKPAPQKDQPMAWQKAGPAPFTVGSMPLVVQAAGALSAIQIETPNGYCVQGVYGGLSGLKSVLEVLRCL